MHKIWQPKLYNTDGAVIKDKCRMGTIYGTFANLNVGVINSTVELTHDTIVTTHGTLPPGSWYTEAECGLNISQLN